MDKFLNKYRIDSARAGWWDYSASGIYFITICTDGHEHLFGKIRNGEMILSEIGIIVNQEWYRSFEIRRELFSDSFGIMPNHIHAILRIENNESGETTVADESCDRNESDNHIDVETHGRASLRVPVLLHQSRGIAFRPSKSISSFIAGFKSVATKRINEFRKTPGSPVWQTRFHDHIIRNSDEFERINKYILYNPQNWKHDDFNIP